MGWAWTIVAGGGGLGLLIIRGVWPPTNGWFALFSGLAACPLLGWSLNKFAGIRIAFWVQLVAAVLIMLAGRAALLVWPWPNP
jgi:hypothetical protein